jgi:hypothetical protein
VRGPERNGTSPRARMPGLLVVVVIAISFLAGCGRVTSLCSEAAELAAAGQLGPATAKYAMASQRGDGDCADSGLDASAGRYADAYANVARGQEAEAVGDVSAATAAYQAALAFDVGNPMARDGLARLQQPVPEPSVPEPVSAPAPGEPVEQAGNPQTALLVAATSLLLLVVGLLIWLLKRDRTDEVLGAVAAVGTAYAEILAAEQEHGRALRDAREALESSMQEAGANLGSALQIQDAAAARRTAALERQIDRLLDFVGSTRRDGAEPIRRRFVRQEPGQPGV